MEELIGSGIHLIHSLFRLRISPRSVGSRRVCNVEGVLQITGGMLLWHEKGVEIPEAGFDVSAFTSA